MISVVQLAGVGGAAILAGVILVAVPAERGAPQPLPPLEGAAACASCNAHHQRLSQGMSLRMEVKE